ncbi:PTS sugar transporter subunit IIA [Lactobacillus selangorensis]|nr:PTS fructose transporter subunit IIA [Lactobacillus selangorensis]
MKYLLLVSHGSFSTGLKGTLSMFAGDEAMKSVIAVGLKPDESVSKFETRFKVLLETLPDDSNFVVLADIIGGSPLTTVCSVLNEHGKLQDAVVLGGMNFPMALTTLMSKDSMKNSELKEKALSEAAAALKDFKTEPSDTDDNDDDI